jgi:hypothetical protein
MNKMKKIRMGFWINLINPALGGEVFYVVNWSSPDWPGPGYPMPTDELYVMRSETNGPILLIPGEPSWIEMYFEIPYFNPEWVSVDIFGMNILVQQVPMPPPVNSLLFPWYDPELPGAGIIVHECLPKDQGQIDQEYGDAPEEDTAYINPVVIGHFPTCVQVGPPNSYISHGCPNPLFFGGLIDCEPDGNAGFCPSFGPNLFNMDECGTIPYSFPPNPDPAIGLVDEGLFLPAPNTLGLLQSNFYGYFICGTGNRQALDTICNLAQWGQQIDIWIDSRQAFGGFFNILFDWNQDGDWNDVAYCQATPVPEHALVNWPVPGQFWGPASALPVPPPPIQVGPNSGYVWARFTLTEQPVQLPWDGSGVFADGETEDYLLYIAPMKSVIPLANWALYLAVGLIMLFTWLIWWRRK